MRVAGGGQQLEFPLTADPAEADAWWYDTARRALAELAGRGSEFTTDDVRDLGVDEPRHPSMWGALFRRAAQAGQIEAVAAQRSRRPVRNGSLVRVWRGTEAA